MKVLLVQNGLKITKTEAVFTKTEMINDTESLLCPMKDSLETLGDG